MFGGAVFGGGGGRLYVKSSAASGLYIGTQYPVRPVQYTHSTLYYNSRTGYT